MARPPALPTWSIAGRPLMEGRVAFTPDSRHLVVHGVLDGAWLQIWDVAGRAVAITLDRHYLTGVGVGRGGILAVARDRFLRVERRGRGWAAREFPHTLPGDDPADYGNHLWVRAMGVGAAETVVVTRRWIARVATADPGRLLGFHSFRQDMLGGGWGAVAVRRHRGRFVVSVADTDTSRFDMQNPDRAGVQYRFVTMLPDGRVQSELVISGAEAELVCWVGGPTATAVLPPTGRRRAAVFHSPGGVAEVRPLAGGTAGWYFNFNVSASGQAVVGVTRERVTRWTRDGRTPTTVAVPGRLWNAQVSPDGRRCVLLDNTRDCRPSGLAVDLDIGRVLGRCLGHPGSLTPAAFSPGGRLFASLVTHNTESDYPDRCRAGTVVVSDLGG